MLGWNSAVKMTTKHAKFAKIVYFHKKNLVFMTGSSGYLDIRVDIRSGIDGRLQKATGIGFSCPVGTSDNRPALSRRCRDVTISPRPVGTVEYLIT